MAVPLLTAKIVKKRTKHFKRAHSDRYIGLKVSTSHPELLPTGIRTSGYFSWDDLFRF
jgi:large subunit ribosomal protein L32e